MISLNSIDFNFLIIGRNIPKKIVSIGKMRRIGWKRLREVFIISFVLAGPINPLIHVCEIGAVCRSEIARVTLSRIEVLYKYSDMRKEKQWKSVYTGFFFWKSGLPDTLKPLKSFW